MSLPDHSELEGKAWNNLPGAVRDQILQAFGYDRPSLKAVESFDNVQRAWLNVACLDVTGHEAAIESINQGRSTQVGIRQTLDGRSVTSAYALTHPLAYMPYYPILHNCPFTKRTVADFPVNVRGVKANGQ